MMPDRRSDQPLTTDYDGNMLSLWAIALRVADRYGAVALIAMFLVWMVTNGFALDLKGARAEIREVNSLLTEHMAEQRFYLRAICVHTATDDAQRADCYRPN